MDDQQELWERMRQRLQARPQPSGDDAEAVDEELFSGLPEIAKLPPPQAAEAGLPEQGPAPAAAGAAESPLAGLMASPMELLQSGVPAGFGCILSTMVLFGLLGLPGSLGAASGGYFGGRLAGDPARALTAAMLPFLLVAAIGGLADAGGLPPVTGPQDLGATIGEWLDYSPGEGALGPLSQLPDSGSAVFVTVVIFAFVGGLSEAARRD